ncbi:MAG: hypothetical protein M1839_006527 [Geoglossum umbratile]|nr:MAG: hypothetical protein M1839_006527 [Geoglossum umbratile]
MPRKPSIPITYAAPSPSSPQTFFDGHALPGLLVFDLDYTLWPFWVDTHVWPPLKAKDGGQRVVDRTGEPFTLYPNVAQVLRDARAKGLRVAAASRSEAPELAREMLKLLVIGGDGSGGGGGGGGNGGGAGAGKQRAIDYFDYLQIYPGSKTTHLAKLKKLSGVEYGDMLFFDDEERNRNVEADLGVLMYLVRDGVTSAEVDRAVREWRAKRGKDGSYIP